MMMMLAFRFLLHRVAAKKLVFFLLFLAVARALGIVLLHLHALLGGKLRQVPNKANELPAILFRAVRAAKRRHAREAYAVFNNPENLAICQLLRLLTPQIWRLWIQIASKRCVTASVIRVAYGAVIGEVQSSVAKIARCVRRGILQLPRTPGNGHVPHLARHHDLKR